MGYVKTLDAPDYRHPYFAPRFAAACRLRIYETPAGAAPRPTVYLVTHLLGGEGTGITSAAEELAAEVVRMQRARRGLSPGDPRHRFSWVHHYPAAALPGFLPEEAFCVVRFEELPGGDLARPSWQHVTRPFVESLVLGLPLDD